MTAINISLTAEERELLTRLLDTALGDARVEVHHTHYSPDSREFLKRQESVIRELLNKLRSGGSGGGAVPT